MKIFRRISRILILAIIVLFPFVDSDASSVSVPISVDWHYGDEKWDQSPHRSDVKLEAIGNAPAVKEDFFGSGDLSFNLKREFKNPGKYEYLVYQTNDDIIEENRSVFYDKTVYRLIFYVQNSSNGLIVSTYAYNNEDYSDSNLGKSPEIKFKNNDPNKDGGSAAKPNEPSETDPGKTSQKDNPQAKPKNTLDPAKASDQKEVSKNKNPKANVQTGIESVMPWLLVLVAAIVAYCHTKNDIFNNKARS
ncbi:hypothetical protein [Anaerococcus provencensis]|uniref:hypothetical protein n=1 Tax=Anaerococcus provencensis TaxID=938293 RepID=UPI0002F3EFCB|nr:hypothetical protein [Anaerococcus provencensis]